MIEDPSDYEDPGDKVDYQVIRSYGRVNRSSARTNNLYFLISLIIIILLCIMTALQAGTIRKLERRVMELETEVNTVKSLLKTEVNTVKSLEDTVRILDTKLKNLESRPPKNP